VQFGCAEVVVQLLESARAEDHRRDGRTIDQPGKGNLRHRHATLGADRPDGVDDVPCAFDPAAAVVRLDAAVGVLAQAGRAGRALLAAVLAGQPAAAER
jgi:hypothetical protein